MPIGSVPANSTKATALEFVLDPVTRAWEITQPASWYPGGTVFIPPGQSGHVPATVFELWYKWKPTSLILANFYSTIGATVWNVGDGAGYRPGFTEGAHVTVSDFDELYPVYGMRVQYYTNIIKDGYYYFKVLAPAPNTVPVTLITLRVNTFERGESNIGAIVVQDHRYDGAVVVMNKTYEGEILNSDTVAKHIFTAEDGHSIGGSCGDILPMSGITCIEDRTFNGVSLRGNNYKDRVSFNIGSIYCIRRDSFESRFWISYLNSGTSFIRSITVGSGGTGTAVLGPIFSPTGVDAANGAKVIGVYNNQILYYTLFANVGEQIGQLNIKRWNLQTNSAMSDFYPGDASMGQIMDILPLSNGDVLVGTLHDGVGGHTFWVAKFNIAGNMTNRIKFGPETDGYLRHYRINYGETNDLFYVWKHFLSSPGMPISGFAKTRVSDLTIINWAFANEFYNQALLNESSLYNNISTSTPQNPIISWGSDRGYIISWQEGPGTYANFWINPFSISVPTIPPVVPPIEPPPINPLIGGGLIMLDPANTVKHDVFLSKTGQPLTSAIQLYIRTAFIGD